MANVGPSLVAGAKNWLCWSHVGSWRLAGLKLVASDNRYRPRFARLVTVV
jgi:hypothetical protein